MDEIRRALIEHAGALEKKYAELTELIAAPEILGDAKLWQKYALERSNIEKTALVYRKYLEYKELYDAYLDESSKTRGEQKLALERELSLIAEDIEELYAELALAASGEESEVSSVVIEIASENRSSGGFAGDIIKAYRAFAKNRGYTSRIEKEERYPGGNPKETVITVEGIGARDYLLHESGIHRAELPGSKSATISVYVYNAPANRDYTIKEDDIHIDLFHSSGAGGQNINKVETAVRAKHIPTGIVVVCKDERSQLMNRNRATEELKARVRAYYEKLSSELYAEGKEKARSHKERIRLYDYNAEKVTDLRADITLPFKGEDPLYGLLTALKLKRD